MERDVADEFSRWKEALLPEERAKLIERSDEGDQINQTQTALERKPGQPEVAGIQHGLFLFL
jgi:hypothetical protein